MDIEMTDVELLHSNANDKLSEEQSRFRDFLFEIISYDKFENHEYSSGYNLLHEMFRYVIQEDILLAFEDMDLFEDQYKALLAAEEPLLEMFKEYNSFETDHMDYIRSAIENVGYNLHLDAWKGEEVRTSGHVGSETGN